jgi:hypothetical protein
MIIKRPFFRKIYKEGHNLIVASDIDTVFTREHQGHKLTYVNPRTMLDYLPKQL